jgi:hypothetical protein
MPSPLAARYDLEFGTSYWYLPSTKLVSKRKPFGSALSNRVCSPVGTVMGRQWREELPGTASCAPGAKRTSVLLPSFQVWQDHWYPRVYIGHQTLISVDNRQHIRPSGINVATYQDVRLKILGWSVWIAVLWIITQWNLESSTDISLSVTLFWII